MCGYDIDRMSAIEYIKTELSKNTDADDIMAELVKSFSNIEDFRTALCDGDKCKTFFENINEVPKDQKQLWRLHYKITKICKEPSETCNFTQVQQFYTDRKKAMEQYNANYTEANVDELITALEQITINDGGKQRGGKQRGGNLVQIVTLIAGIEVALSKAKNAALDVKNKLYALCQKAGSAIYNAPSVVSECLRSLMGETLYKILKNMAKGAIGAGLLTEVYQNIENIINVLLSIVKYVPYVAGLLTMLSTGLVVFKLAEKLGNKVPGLVDSVTQIVTNAVNEIDAIDIDTIQSTVVDAITQKLKDASKAEKKLIEQEMNDFKATIHEILYNATLSPEAIAANKQLMQDIDERAAAMVEQIQANIAQQKQINEHRQAIAATNAIETDDTSESNAPISNASPLNAQVLTAPISNASISNASPLNAPISTAPISTAPISTAPISTAPISTAKRTVSKAQLPSKEDLNTEEKLNNNPFGFGSLLGNPPGGKPHKKHHKKTHKKSAAKHHKKSRKQRRSRKH